MRQETNNDVDLLLRRLSRRQGVPVSDGASHNDSDHLDADELNSYAENALPAAARARYTEHLAECSSCRQLVVQLSASVPIVAAKETATTLEPSGLRKFLASFFSPMVLRFAVPALGLVVVAAIGFVVLRSSSRREYLAQLEANRSSESAPLQSAESKPPGLFDSPARTESDSKAVARAGDVESTKATSSKDAQPAPPNAEPAAPVSKVDSNRDATPTTAERQGVANAAPAAPSGPSPAATVDEVRVEVEGRRANEPVRTAPAGDLARQKAAEEVKEEQEKRDFRAASRGRGQAAAPQTGGSTSLYSVEGKDKNQSRDDGVIRSAGGRRFRKQKGVWVDTAYNSANRMVDVSRGSEQYRALVADEPTIKTIADELEGTIVVVWKGSTYRIR